MNKPIGRILVENRLVSVSQLEEAIQNQVIYGGKLGTNLMELGYINLATLSKVLSKKHGCPAINPFQIKPVSRELLRMVGKKLAVKYQVVPLGTDGKNLDMLMGNPSDITAIDEIQFATGKRIRPFVSPEIVINSLIEKYYGVEMDFRYLQLAERVLKPPAPGESKPAKTQSAPKAAAHPEIKGLEFGAAEDLSSEEEFQKLLFAYNRPHGLEEEAPAGTETAGQAQAPPAPPAPVAPSPPSPAISPSPPSQPVASSPPQPPPQQVQPPQLQPAKADEERPAEVKPEIREPVQPPAQAAAPPKPEQPLPPEIEEEEEPVEEILEELPEALTLKEALDRLQQVGNRDELSKTVLAFALSYFKRAAIFITRGGVAMGWDGMGGSINRRNVQSIMLPLNTPSIFKTVHDSCSFYLGAIPPTPINERFLKLIGGEKPRSVFLIPILFGGKVVNILYGDNGNAANAPTEISELLILAPRVPQAFESLIKRKKQEARNQS